MSCILPPHPRPRDAFGDGAFKARRDGGSRLHMGIDICAWPGQEVVAWEHGLKYLREARPYADDQRFGGVLLEAGDGKRIYLFYIAPSKHFVPGLILAKGDVIGVVQDLRIKYVNITPHIHIGIKVGVEYIDPSDYIEEAMS